MPDSGGSSAVDDEDLAGDELGKARAEKERCACDVVGSAADAERVGGDGLVDVEAAGPEGCHLLLDAWCVDDAGC